MARTVETAAATAAAPRVTGVARDPAASGGAVRDSAAGGGAGRDPAASGGVGRDSAASGGAGRDPAAGGGAGRDPAASGGEARLTSPPRARLEPYLEASEITAEVRPYGQAIERCYLARLGESRRAGKLDLTLLIGRDGSVVSVTVTADGLSARAARKASACIREATAALRFPPRRNDTTAVVPYYFQRTEAPGAGPQLSCWNPRGC